MKNFTLNIDVLNTEIYQTIRNTTNWESIENHQVEIALKKDLFSIMVSHLGKPVGIGRVIGDGAIYFYIQDVIVIPDYQGIGVGRLIMEGIENYLSIHATGSSFIGLMAVERVEGFYEKYGYNVRPSSKPGMYRIGYRELSSRNEFF